MNGQVLWGSGVSGMEYSRAWTMVLHPLRQTQPWEKALGLELANGSDPRLGSLISRLEGLKWKHSRVPWGALQQGGDWSGYKEQTHRSI